MALKLSGAAAKLATPSKVIVSAKAGPIIIKNKDTAQNLWDSVPNHKQASMGCSVFINRMHHHTNEGLYPKAKDLIRTLFLELFPNEDWPRTQTWWNIGHRVAYRLQYLDWKILGKSPAEEWMVKYRLAMGYRLRTQDDPMLLADGWGLDGSGTTPGSNIKQPRKQGEGKGSTKPKLDALTEKLATTKGFTVKCGMGTKGQTIFSNAGPNKVKVDATKQNVVYDTSTNYERNVLFNRLWRWSRKENILT